MRLGPEFNLRNPEFRGRVGVARADITPPVGIYARAWGSAVHDVAEGVHRPLLASCLVFQDLAGSAELIVLALDVMVLWQREAVNLRTAILSQLDLKPRQLMVHPSHTHASPMFLRTHMDRPGGQFIAPYLDSLPSVCISLIAKARDACQPAIVGWAYGKCAMAFNRDFIDPASGRDVCGVNPQVPADDTLLVGRVTAANGQILATMVNYACHPVSLGSANRLLSPDYIGAMREVIEAQAGGICVFFHGASGDMTPRRCYEADVTAADQNGRELGNAALAALNSMFPPGQQLVYRGVEESGTALGVWHLADKKAVSGAIDSELVTTTLPLKELPPRAEIERRIADKPDRLELERLERLLARRDLVGDGIAGDFYLTVWRLGDAFLVSTPAEPYSQFQIELRSRFPDAAITVLNATDGCLNYLPVPSAYARNVYQARVALYKQGALETVVNLATDAIRRLS